MTQRSHLFRMVLGTLFLVATGIEPICGTAHGQSLQAPARGRVVTLGRLIRSGKASNGTPRFALLDDEGTLTSYVIPASGLDLASYVNQQVAVTVRRSRNSTSGIKYLLAESIKPLGAGFDLPAPEVTPTLVTDAPRLMPEVEAFALNQTMSSTGSGLRTPPLQPTPATPRANFEPIPAGLVPGDRYDEAMPLAASSEEELFWDDESQGEVRLASHDEYSTIMSTPDYATTYGEPMVGELDHSHGHSCTSCGADVGGGCSNCGSLGACGSACCPCGPSGRFWFRAEYLLWWTKGMDLPPLVTTTNGNPLPQDAGVLGVDGTRVLFGDQEIFDESRSGFRFRVGTWLDYCQWKGFEFDYFWLEDEHENFSRTSVGNPILARPFFNSNLNMEDAELVAYPGIVSGTVNVRAETEFLAFAPRFRMNLRCENFLPDAACGCGSCNDCGDTYCRPTGGQRVDFTLGYRHMTLDERLRITEQLSSTSNGSTTNFNLRDSFRTENAFHGAEIGMIWEYYRGPWSLEFFSRFGLGNNRREVRIAGSTESAVQGASFTDVGGLLALPSNIGSYRDDEFVVIPELGVNLGYQIAPSIRFLVGYTFIYWNNVVRPGDQIDLRVNTDLLPPAVDTSGLSVPSFAFNDSSFWAQGLSLGLDWRW